MRTPDAVVDLPLLNQAQSLSADIHPFDWIGGVAVHALLRHGS